MDIKGVIKKKGYTIEKVAEGMGINRISLSQTLSRNPTIRTLERIADVIGCKVGDFFADELEKPDNSQEVVCPYCGRPIKIHMTAEKG